MSDVSVLHDAKHAFTRQGFVGVGPVGFCIIVLSLEEKRSYSVYYGASQNKRTEAICFRKTIRCYTMCSPSSVTRHIGVICHAGVKSVCLYAITSLISCFLSEESRVSAETYLDFISGTWDLGRLCGQKKTAPCNEMGGRPFPPVSNRHSLDMDTTSIH
jgi:hypothetical protein